jgi:hypothetical protein
VVTEGVLRIRPGARVTATEATATAGAAPARTGG